MHPTLLEWGPLRLHSYGLLLAVGCAAGIWRAGRQAGRARLTAIQIQDAGILLVLCGLVGARLAYVGLNWREFAADPLSILAIWDGGLTFYGGLAAGTAAGFYITRKTGAEPARFADLTAPCLALGYSIARLGCLLNGCCYGRPTSVPWSVRFHADGGSPLTAPSHPVQLYSSGATFLIFLMLAAMEKRHLPPGLLFGVWLVLSSIERFVMEEFRRGATAQAFWNGLTQAQAVSIVLLCAGGVIIARSRRREAARA